jgi:CubicO group peptidase (beta-lactamase class C family)
VNKRIPALVLCSALALFSVTNAVPNHPPILAAADDPAERIARIEAGLLPAVLIEGRPAAKMLLSDRMTRYRVPGVTVAVIDQGRIEWAKGYGVCETGGATVTEHTLFQAASISKPVAALAALRLVEQKKLSLDDDINTVLKSWKVPASAALGDRKVTVREILSHSAGLSVHGFRGYAQGEPVPAIQQILDGEKPANSAAIRVVIPPLTRWQYSGGGYTVLQQAIVDIVQKPFAALMRDLVLRPVGMKDSTYEQPLPDSLLAHAAAGYRSNGNIVTGKRHTYPEQAAAGLWTTPADLLKFAAELQKAYAGRSGSLISRSTAEQMLRRQFENWGLGLQIEGEGENLRFSHGGGNEGFRCFLVAYAARGQGAAIMTNSDAGPSLYNEILRAIAAEYGWPDFQPARKKSIELPPDALREYAGQYQVEPGLLISIRLHGGALFLQAGPEETEIVPESESRFFSPENGAEVAFTRDAEGAVTELQGRVSGREIKARKTAAQL